MLIPLKWLEKYITLKHTNEEFGQILTKLDSMQDGPIKMINNLPVIDLEVRQNRPDLLSIIGIAREYAAYINENVTYPKSINDTDLLVEWGTQKENLKVQSIDVVKRFITIEIQNVKVKASPKWMRDELESYGIPSINNIVDITNYVMLEYGMPLHAFDKDKLETKDKKALLTLRHAINDEPFETWQGTKIKLTTNDIVVSDAEKAIAIAGVIGGANSGIDKETTNIILESATYNHASIRRTAIRHNIITDASIRHSKFLNPNMGKVAIKRALGLIKELASGEIIRIEDYYNENERVKFENRTIDFNINQILRLAGVQLESEKVIEYLSRLGFEVIEQKEAIGLDKHILIIKIPDWRTDISYEEDIVEEVIRLWNYDNIPMQEINSAPPSFVTPKVLILEEKIKNILVSLGYDEQITNPLCKYMATKTDFDGKQIKLENALTSELDGLRTSIADTLNRVIENSKKANVKTTKVFESGKIYWEHKVGEYKEERRITVLTYGYTFQSLKADILSVLNKLGLKTTEELSDNTLKFVIEKNLIATLYRNRFEIYIEDLINLVRIDLVPFEKIETEIKQRIEKEISLKILKSVNLGDIASLIKSINKDIIEDVLYVENEMDNVENLKIIFFNLENKLTKNIVNETIKKVKLKITKQFPVEIR